MFHRLTIPTIIMGVNTVNRTFHDHQGQEGELPDRKVEGKRESKRPLKREKM